MLASLVNEYLPGGHVVTVQTHAYQHRYSKICHFNVALFIGQTPSMIAHIYGHYLHYQEAHFTSAYTQHTQRPSFQININVYKLVSLFIPRPVNTITFHRTTLPRAVATTMHQISFRF